MKIQTIAEKFYGENCYAVSDGISNECAVIDPASPEVVKELRKLSLEPKFILLTHGHFDHIGGTDALAEAYGIPVYVHKDDAELLTDGYKNASSLLIGTDVVVKAKAIALNGGDALSLGSLEFKAVHTPGHTRGCVCYFCGDAVFTGDTVFAYDRGRTDLYGGDEAAIVESIQTLIPMLSGKTIYPGHGPARKF
jgi:glyoxylase-like metal-dependent hydrolase (beta-lactamase superfamily II)